MKYLRADAHYSSGDTPLTVWANNVQCLEIELFLLNFGLPLRFTVGIVAIFSLHVLFTFYHHSLF